MFLENVHYKILSNGCWLWLKGCDGRGYPVVHIGKKALKAHRVSYENKYGLIPKCKEGHHRCEFTKCINPDHVEPKTRQEHNKLGLNIANVNRNKLHCKQGHEYSKENTGYRMSKGISCRYCKTCARKRSYINNAIK